MPWVAVPALALAVAWFPVDAIVGHTYDVSAAVSGTAAFVAVAGEILVFASLVILVSGGKVDWRPASLGVVLIAAGVLYGEREHHRFGLNISAGLNMLFSLVLVPAFLVATLVVVALVALGLRLRRAVRVRGERA